MPAPIAAEAQSKPSLTLSTTGASGWTGPVGVSAGAGRALATGAARARTARPIRTRRVMRCETFMTASFRGGRGVTPMTLAEGGRQPVYFPVYARLDRRADLLTSSQGIVSGLLV